MTSLPAATAPSSLLLANCRRADEEEEDDEDFATVARWSWSGEVVNIPDDDAVEGRPELKNKYFCNEF